MMDEEDLSAWVERARTGDGEAFAVLVEETWSSLVGLARVLLVEHGSEAEDVVQEAYCKAWLGLPRLRRNGAFLGWMRQITLREALRHRSRPRREETLMPSVTAAPNQRDGDLERALSRLPPRQRAVLFLGEIEGLSDEEVASVLGIRRSTVRVHRQRGRRRLRELLEVEGHG